MINKKILIIIGVLTLITLVVSYIGYDVVYEKSFNAKMAELALEKKNAALTNKMAGWKTYRNEKYGFEFKYPSKLGNTTQVSESNINCNSEGYLEVALSPGTERLQVGLACEKAFDRMEYKGEAKPIAADGRIASMYEYVSATGYTNKEVYIPIDNGYHISLSHTYKSGRDDYTELSSEEFQKIISTIKFTK